MINPTSPPPAVIYPAPKEEIPSPDFTLQAGGLPVFVYQARVRTEILQNQGLWTHKPDAPAQRASFAIFDTTGPVSVLVTPLRPFQSVTVLPHRAGVTADIKDGSIRFTLDKPRHLTLLLDGSDLNPLHLFIGKPETDVPKKDDPDTIYFGPGTHLVPQLAVKSGQTVYLAGGAVVKTTLAAGEKGTYNEKWKVTFFNGTALAVNGARNVRICGRGILDGSLVPHPGRNLIRVGESDTIRVEGIMLRDSPNWNVIIDHSQNVVVDDLRIISGRLNSDGINSVNSSRVAIRNCFVRNHDDSIVVKTTKQGRAAEDIEVEDCQVWDDWGFGLGVTYETRSPVRHIRFRGCSVLFARHWCMGIRVCDASLISDIGFDDIEIADLSRAPYLGAAQKALNPKPLLLWAGIVKDVWGHDPEPGRIKGVSVSNVTIYGPEIPKSEIMGYDAQHLVEDVTIRNVRLHGQPPTANAAALGLTTNAFTAGVSVLP
jgi:polygalacturonase